MINDTLRFFNILMTDIKNPVVAYYHLVGGRMYPLVFWRFYNYCNESVEVEQQL